jgi:hypothetical protein
MTSAQKTLLWTGVVVILAVGIYVCLPGCSKPSLEASKPAASSSLTLAQARAGIGAAWIAEDPINHAVEGDEPTGSMLPVIGSNCLLLLERFNGQVPNQDDMLSYWHDASLPSVTHRCTAVDLANKAWVPAGDNNSGSDGWQPIANIRWRVAGIIYCQQAPAVTPPIQ